MSSGSILKAKSFDFAVRIVKFCNQLQKNRELILVCNQVLRAATSIGALIREAEHAESRKDFIHKLSIALKETNETLYWLEILISSGIIEKKLTESLVDQATELLKMLIASIKTSKSKISS